MQKALHQPSSMRVQLVCYAEQGYKAFLAISATVFGVSALAADYVGDIDFDEDSPISS